LGEVRFAIGLWVGRSATANTMGQVTRAIVEYKSGKGATPFPLTHCPWCREELGPKGLTLKPDVKQPEAVEVACVNHRCDFNQRNGGLPVLFVDEQIYRELPAFVLATVDKFAMLPWRGETGALFGRVHSHDGGRFFGPMDGASPRPGHTPLPSGLLPPELIVQDEVHLIAGPLGTMVGLYEAVIERLCLWETVSGAPRRPKILASTATVRRAGDQMKALFGRSATAIFPPPGVDEGESFFAERDPTAPDRRYLGVAAPGRSFKAVQLRTYVVLLTAAWHQRQRHGAAADPWLSVLGYYNSLRELGGMRRLAEDEVISRAHRADERKPLDAPGPHRWVAQRKLESDPVELTSRESTAKIARAKARLGVPHGDKGAVDIALATNMISVGLDIDRLGLMVVAGQPKTTAEYIQASSRVGRQATRGPGLVVTCLNVYRPRDLSHYEHFGAYHASFYRYVEANSLTPFSAPALDRGLAGVLVALVRLSDPGFTAPRGVEQLPARRAQVDDLLQVLVQRAVNVSNLDQAAIEALEASVALRARTLLDTWEKIVTQAVSDDAGKRCYSGLDRGHNGKALLRMALSDDDEAILSPEELRFIAPTSMRDVEPSIHVWVGFKPEGKS
ncbi:MAG: helicase, partial [Myxococcales bacterium]|nr:helicase [Myxococcales bacterium]